MEYEEQKVMSDLEDSVEEKFTYGFLSNQQRDSQNQLKVGNPADYKNSEDNGPAFEKSKTPKTDNKKANDAPNISKATEKPPGLPTRGILKRAKVSHGKEVDKKGV